MTRTTDDAGTVIDTHTEFTGPLVSGLALKTDTKKVACDMKAGVVGCKVA